ncbi:MAG: ATP-binding cassette domain-containing protein [Candidatus Omnitrophica bacterium]|nr:ATP-binding cassette domain-containing protein [Candidatus Omnitrophota bacterium]
MITTSGLALQYGKRVLFSGVNITFTQGNCYGVIGANGSGKSTFLKILSGEIESTRGEVFVTPGERISVLKQDQFAFDEYTVLTTVILGHKRLYDLIKEKEAVYAKPDFTEADGIHASELEGEFDSLGGWNADSDAVKLLDNLGIPEELRDVEMRHLEGGQKFRVLLAQALFGNPDILLLDEPTNNLDVESAMWLEDFLIDFPNISIVVSHDRHFLDKVCTHIVDIDFGAVQLFPGNYSFWMQSSQLALRQKTETNKKMMDKRKELMEFIARFSANASKARQATSRKKSLEKLVLEDIKPSSRKYPYINFEYEKETGNNILSLNALSASQGGEELFKDVTLTINRNDKVALVGYNDLAKTALFRILMKEIQPEKGSFIWGISTKVSYYPKDNTGFFDSDMNLIDWLSQYSDNNLETYLRGFLGRMLFSGDEALKKVNVLSGGEKVRCMLSRMMLAKGNVLLLDEPTNHLDLESITSLNEGLVKFKGPLIFSSHDHELIQTVANRIIEITPKGFIDRADTTYDEYLTNPAIAERRKRLYP